MKPHIIVHMLTSLNGKIAGDFGNSARFHAAWQMYDEAYHHFNAQAWLAGRITMQHCIADEIELPTDYPDFDEGDFIANPNADHFAVAADPFGKLMWQTNELQYGSRPNSHIIELVTEQASQAYLAHLRQLGISYLIVGKRELDLPLALEKLAHHFGIQTLVVSGGGLINGAFAQAGLVDEISLVIAPTLELSSQNTSFESSLAWREYGLSEFQLSSQQTLADNQTLWLTYKK